VWGCFCPWLLDNFNNLFGNSFQKSFTFAEPFLVPRLFRYILAFSQLFSAHVWVFSQGLFLFLQG